MYKKNILLGITGGIAAYKAAELVRLLVTHKINVKVVMTQNATEFITPLTMRTLSGNNVYTKMFDQDLNMSLEHISLARWADAILIAPSSANFIAKLAHGLADDLLTTMCLASNVPIAIAPAMNKEMWHASISQENVTKLKNRGVFILGPASGEQACQKVGIGRMLEPQEILEQLPRLFTNQLLFGKKVVITAGPTHEALDPVRYVGNHSSGKMGYALASAAQEAGAEVVLISGPAALEIPYPSHIKLMRVTTAQEMYQAVMQEVKESNIFICAAAVADYRPVINHGNKLKKDTAKISLELERTPDILATVAQLKKRPLVVGFAAETENLKENAKQKLVNKNLDIVIANQVGNGIGFNSDENSVMILDKSGKEINLAKTSKIKLAARIIQHIASFILR